VLAALRDAAGNTLRSVADSDDAVEREAAG
jgi:hypothetical protein